ncbi:unnamed protein product [Amoebophrya sp. A120]|nr:unnamed protein product [Amoebophrya sp. A120]|eukprot:GSA120T00005237001.1
MLTRLSIGVAGMRLFPLLLYLLTCALPFLPRADAGFRKHGDGRCTFEQEEVTGIKANLNGFDFHVGFKLCRDYCAGAGTSCWGITWSHCRRTCTLHGMPANLFAAQPLVGESSLDECSIEPLTPSPALFKAVGGVSIGTEPPTVMNSDGFCDAVCLVHTMECSVKDNNHNIFVSVGSAAGAQQLKLIVPDVPALQPGRYTQGYCPAGFQGTVDLLCQLGEVTFPPGVTQQMKCNRDCAKGTIQALESKQVVVVPAMAHGSFQDIPCPDGYGGPLRLRCFNGQYMYTDQKCGHDCPAGNILDNGALLGYNPMPHRSTQTIVCKAPYQGVINLQCDNAVVTVLSGNCLLGCPVGTPDPVTNIIIPGSPPRTLHPKGLKYSYMDEMERPYTLDYPVTVVMEHDEKRVANCPGQYAGQFEMHCYHGQIAIITIGTPCEANCNDLRPFMAGQFLKAIPSVPAYSGEVKKFPCEETGTLIDAKCVRGRFQSQQVCYRNCLPQVVYHGGMPLNLTNSSKHGEIVRRDCETGFYGIIEMACDDGWAYVATFECGQNCAGGQFPLGKGVVVSFGEQLHLSTFQATCPDGYVGTVMMRCEDGTPSYQSGICLPTTTTTTTTTRALYCHNTTISLAYNDTQYVLAANKSGHVMAYNVSNLTYLSTMQLQCPPGFGGPVEIMCDAWGALEESQLKTFKDSMTFPGSSEAEYLKYYDTQNFATASSRELEQQEFGTFYNGESQADYINSPMGAGRGGGAASSTSSLEHSALGVGTTTTTSSSEINQERSTRAYSEAPPAPPAASHGRQLHHPALPFGQTLPPAEQTRHDMGGGTETYRGYSINVEQDYNSLRGRPYWRVATYLNATTSLFPPYQFDHARRYGDQYYDAFDENKTDYGPGRPSLHQYNLDAALYPYKQLPRIVFVSRVTSCGQSCYGPLVFEHFDTRYETGSHTYEVNKNLLHGEEHHITCPGAGNLVRFVCWDGIFVKMDQTEICGVKCVVNDLADVWRRSGLTQRLDYNTTLSIMFTFATTTTTTPPPTTEPPPLLLGMTRPPMITSDIATTTPDPLFVTDHFDFFSAQNFTGFQLEHMETKLMSCWNNHSNTDLFSSNPLLLCYNGNVTFGSKDFSYDGKPPTQEDRVAALQDSVACGRNCPAEGFLFKIGRADPNYVGFARNPFTEKYGHLDEVGDDPFTLFLEFFWGNQPTARTEFEEHEWDVDVDPLLGTDGLPIYDNGGYTTPEINIDPRTGLAIGHPQFSLEFGHFRPVRTPGFTWRDELQREPTFSLMRNGEQHSRNCEDILGRKSAPVPGVPNSGGHSLFMGTVNWQCQDGTVNVQATCKRRCVAAQYRKAFPGGNLLLLPRDDSVYYDHGEEVLTPCTDTNKFANGTGILRVCDDGELKILEENCVINCRPYIYQGTIDVLPPRVVEHGTTDNVFECPPYLAVGTYRVECFNGIRKVPAEDFTCKRHCLPLRPGELINDEFRHGFIYHDTFHKGQCADNSTISVGCSDAQVRIVGGDCGFPCLAGEILLDPRRPLDPPVQYPKFYHMQTLTVSCTGGSVGTAELLCQNSQVTAQNVNCNAECPVRYDLDTTLWVDTSVQDDFDPRNYGKLSTGKVLQPDTLQRYSCAGGEALVKCDTSGETAVEGVIDQPCGIPLRLCGCCALSSQLPTAGASSLRRNFESFWTRNGIVALFLLLRFAFAVRADDAR